MRLEMAMFDVQAAARGDNSGSRRRVVLLRYEPDELLDPAIPAEDLQPLASGVTVLIDATGTQLSVRRVDDRLEGRVADGLRSEWIEVRGEMPVGAVSLDQ